MSNTAADCFHAVPGEMIRWRPARPFGKAGRGYTLIETLVALVIFALITSATSFALNTAIRGQRAAQQRAEDLQEARTLLRIISEDLRSAYASRANANTFFLASGSDMETLLTFTALNHRIDVEPESHQNAPFDPEAATPPQSDISVIRYSFNPERGEFSRSLSPVPNPDTLPQPGIPSTVLSRRVRSVELEFLDQEAGFRTDWDFYTDPNSLNASPAGSDEETAGQTDSDTVLPKLARIRILLEGQNRRPYAYDTMIALATPEPQTIGQKPPATQNPQPVGSGGANGPPGSGGAPSGSGGQPGGPLPGIPGLPGLPGAGGSRP